MRQNTETGEEAICDVFEERPDDFYIPDDLWTLVYEGVVASRSDVVVDANISGAIRSQGGNFCNVGVQRGDLVTIVGSPTPGPNVEAGTCDVFRDVALTYQVKETNASYLMLNPIALPDAVDGEVDPYLNLRPASTNGLPLARTLPTRECFAAGLTIEVRPMAQWVLTGERSGVLVNQTSAGGACVPRYDIPNYRARFQTGDTVETPFFSFVLRGGIVTPTRDFSMRFNTENSFTSSVLGVGPSSTDVQMLETAVGNFLVVPDAGTNIVRVFITGGRDELRTILF